MRASLTLICQGETAASRGSHFPCDDPLEAREWQRARQLQSSVARYHRVWFAPDAAALSLQGTPVTELAEPDYGIWAGRPVHEVMMQDAEAFQAWLEGAAPPGGESRAQLLARCGSWLAKHVDIRGRHCACRRNPRHDRRRSRRPASLICAYRHPPAEHHRVAQRRTALEFVFIKGPHK